MAAKKDKDIWPKIKKGEVVGDMNQAMDRYLHIAKNKGMLAPPKQT